MSARSRTLADDPFGASELALELLLEQLKGLGHRRGEPVVVALPPGWSMLAAVPALSRRGILRGLWRNRAAALGPLFANLGQASLATLSLLALHGVQQEFLFHLKELAQRHSIAFVGPTSWNAHPRTHWERWPDSPHTFHQAWSVSPTVQLHGVRESRPPRWMRRLGVMRSNPQPTPVLRTGLPGVLGTIAVTWPQSCAEVGAGSATSTSPVESPAPAAQPLGFQYWPWNGRDDRRTLSRRMAPLAPGGVALTAGLDAVSAIVSRGRGPDGTMVIHAKTPSDIGPDGVCVATCRWPLL